MAKNKRFAATLEKEVVPFLESAEKRLTGTAEVAACGEVRLFIAGMAPMIRSGGHLMYGMAKASMSKIDGLKLPEQFAAEWSVVSRKAKQDYEALDASFPI